MVSEFFTKNPNLHIFFFGGGGGGGERGGSVARVSELFFPRIQI